MLDTFRKRGAKSAIYSIMVVAIIFVFVVQFRQGSENNPLSFWSRKCVAKIRGTCIDEKAWKAQMFLLQGMRENGPALSFNKLAVDSLVERTLLEQEAVRLGIRVSEDDVMQELIRSKVHVFLPVASLWQANQLQIFYGFRWLPFGTKEKPFDQQTFEQVVQKVTGRTATEFTESQAQELVAARMASLIMERVRVGESEAWAQYQNEKSTTSIRYLKFSPSYFAAHFVPVDQGTLDKWASEHAKEVDAREATLPKDQERRILHPRHILIEAKKDAPADKKAEAKKNAEAILARVQKGEDFAKLAKQLSSDEGSKNKGGEYDWTPGYEYVPEFRDALAKLKIGETTLVETQYGFHVLQLLGRYDGKAAVAFPLYRESKGSELAKDSAERVLTALKGRVPVAIDSAIRAKIDEAKKSGKNEADATQQVLDDELKARTNAAVETVLMSLFAKPAIPDDKAKPTTATVDTKPARLNDDQKIRLEESTAFNASSPPIQGLNDTKPILEAIEKLTNDSLMSPVVKGDSDFYIVFLRERKTVARADFDKERSTYMAAMLAKKREDALVNYVTALRDSLGKELYVDPKYTNTDSKGGTAVPISVPEGEEP